MDILSLKRKGHSNRQIAKKVGLDRRTVAKYLKESSPPAYKKINRVSLLDSYKPLIEGWLEQEDYRATRIHTLLEAQGYQGSYDSVKRFVRTIKESRDRKAYIRFETMPGQQAQVDFGDFQIEHEDGGKQTVYAFVMTLGFSRHMYIEFIERCTMRNFLACHQHAFGFFGGIPCEILYDNMKNVVIKRQGQEVRWNQTFEEFALHYGFKAMVTPPYAPWVKGKVERPIDYVREGFWRGYGFVGLERANQDIRQWLKTKAFNRVHGTTRQRVSERFKKEQSFLGGLPRDAYDISPKYFRKVGRDCQVSFDGNGYVVAHELVGKRILLRDEGKVIRFYDDDRLVTVYRKPSEKGEVAAHPQFYRRLREDREQILRKYRKPSGKGKARTRGLVNERVSVDVMKRSLAVYAEVAL
jgi:transposase